MINSPEDLLRARDVVPCGRCGVRCESPRRVLLATRFSRSQFVVLCVECDACAFKAGHIVPLPGKQLAIWKFTKRRR